MINYKTPLSFPVDFYQFDTLKEKDWTNDISYEEITEWIEKCITYLKENPEREYTQMATGNTKVIVERGEDYFEITVMKNYWTGEIPLDCEVKE